MFKHKYKFYLNTAILLSATSIVAFSSLFVRDKNTSELHITKQSTLATAIENLPEYPQIKNSNFINSLIIDEKISQSKLSLYFKLINVPENAIIDLTYAKTFDDGLFNFTLGISPWVNDAGTLVTDSQLEISLSIQLLPPDWKPTTANLMWLWILIGVIGIIALILIIVLWSQARKDRNQFPYKLDLG